MSKWWLVIARERLSKQGLVAHALHASIPGSKICRDDPPVPTDPFVACGQLWVVERIVPAALRTGQPFWLVDNGYYKSSGRGKGHVGHFEFTYRGLVPILLENADATRFPAEKVLKPWRETNAGKHVLIALPGPSFGKMIGLDMHSWIAGILSRVRKQTNRRIRIREKWSTKPLEQDLHNCHCVVTHSSNVAIDALIEGIPAIVAPTNPAAPVCSTDLADIDNPLMPDRSKWWASLMCQQYTEAEMKDGTAWRFMQQIMEQVDGS